MGKLPENIYRVFKPLNYIKKPYYYVPSCPVCGSKQTGRLLPSHGKYNNGWIEKESLKNGEIVHMMEEIPEDVNAFCLNCDAMWQADIKTKFLNHREIEDEKRNRGTAALYSIYMEKMLDDKTALQKSRGPIVNLIANFIGHI